MIERFEALDGFRGIAAVMVAVFHLHVFGVISELNIVKNSYLFVEFFFVLSGFVVGHSYFGKINDLTSLKLFMKKRFARLWPLHMFMTVLFIPFALANIIFNIDVGDRFSGFSFLTNIFLVQSMGLNDGETWNIPAWSISTEFYTYLLFGLLCFCAFLDHKIIGPLVISLLSVYILYSLSSMGDTSKLAIFRCTYSFFMGFIAFRLHRNLRIKPWMEFAIIITTLCILSCFRISTSDDLAFIMPVVFFGVVLVFSHEAGWISSQLKRPFFSWLASLSFSIYMTHAWFFGSIKALSVVSERFFDYSFWFYHENGAKLIDFGFGYFNDLVYIPYLILVFCASHFTYNYLERPCQKIINSIKV